MPPSIAIIGAGLSGATCAHRLAAAGWRVTLFDKSRGVGGRMATRRARFLGPEGVELAVEFDHGASGFAVPGNIENFAAWLAPAQAAGVVVPGNDGRVAHAWMATPDMPALCRWLLQGLTVHTLCAVDAIDRTAAGWALHSAGTVVGAGFDAVVIALPPAQAAALLNPHRADWNEQARAQVMSPCWTLMAVTPAPLEGAHGLSPVYPGNTADQDSRWASGIEPLHDSPLQVVIRQDSKPGRTPLPGLATWVAHARADWSRDHLESPPEAVLPALQAALAHAVGGVDRWHHATVHRWRYAQWEAGPRSAPFQWDAVLGLGQCGDALGGGGVAGAWASATALCDAIQA